MCLLTLTPLLAVFSTSPEDTVLTEGMFKVIFTTLLARPTHNRWIKEVMYFIQFEKIKFTVRSSKHKFSETWSPFLTYFDDLQFTEGGVSLTPEQIWTQRLYAIQPL